MKKILPVAVLAALAGVNGAQAVHVNSEGMGQVLLYPYYSAESDNDTYINLVNTTDEYKAVKIRILESMNSREVLDFNLYMSPQDHWSAVITLPDVSIDPIGAATIRSADNTCTVPLAISQGDTIAFRDFEYQDDSVNGLERTREGYVEVIEMGVVTDSDAQAAILHSNGEPGDCAYLDAQWREGGDWLEPGGDPTDGLTDISGGLYGYGVLIDVPRGAAAGYDAVALDDWADSFAAVQHTAPGSIFPSVGAGTSDWAVFDDGGVLSGTAIDGWDAVSAVLMSGSISNDYVLEPTINGGTDWVVTFPTKREYVNGPSAPEEPFTNAWDEDNSVACEQFAIRYWDREEGEPVEPLDPTDFSPLPPPGDVQTFSFCHEANVLTFNESNVLGASDRTGVNVNLEEGFENGWARVNFVLESLTDERQLDAGGEIFLGLPSIGFAVQRYINGDTGSGVLGNYAVAIEHKGDVVISGAP